jgi:hypothetical protein
MKRFAVCALAVTAFIRLALSQETEFMIEKEFLVSAVQQLRLKTIPEAYFLLSSPRLSHSLTFAPDTRGGAYVLILKDAPFPDGLSGNDLRKVLDEMSSQPGERMRRPEIDEKNRRLVFFSEQAWKRLLQATKNYLTSNEEVTGTLIFKANHPQALLLRIPRGREEAFVRDLIEKGLKDDEDSFPYSVGWN